VQLLRLVVAHDAYVHVCRRCRLIRINLLGKLIARGGPRRTRIASYDDLPRDGARTAHAFGLPHRAV